MSEYGIKIKNFKAGSIFDKNLGLRDNYDYTDAMLANSLFKDFIVANGLSIWKEESTRDIICIDFKYGSRSYEEEIKHIKKIAKNARIERKVAKSLSRDKQIIQKENKKKRISELYLNAENNKALFDKKSRNDLRTLFYENGVDIFYETHNKKGEVIKTEKIHYKMLYRSPGKAKKGSCMFIREELYDVAHEYLSMNIELPKENSPIVEMGAYSSLITSSIVGKVQILPKEMLILNDVDSLFSTKVISIETDEEKHCKAVPIDSYQLKNTLFDGQALIDSSIFPDWGNGYILLRHHLCKMAAFKTNIQVFFKDYFGDKYDTAEVTDMFGNKHLAKDIKLITTDNAMKWLKFKGITFDFWCDHIKENDYMFGIVKTAHESKIGNNMQRMSYQMVNALDINTMQEVLQCSLNYIQQLKQNDQVFLEYLVKNSNFSNDYEVLVALVKQNPDFIRSEYFRDRKKKIIETYTLNLKNGKVNQDADNLVIVGSPYAMLLHAVGEDVNTDPTFKYEEETIQCWTSRFNEGDYLAEFRSPFNSRNNLGYLHNHYHPYFDKYFDFGKLIIAVNLINTDFQDRNNGSDQDSDSIYVTSQPQIVQHARYCYLNYPTIVNNIPMSKNIYDNSMYSYSVVDNGLMAAQTAIGESSNLAQLALSYSYNFTDLKYHDYVCILSVLAQVAIDSAKRSFDIDINEEIKRIKKDMDIGKNKYPCFWEYIRKNFDKEARDLQRKAIKNGTYFDPSVSKINKELICPMNYLASIDVGKFRNNSPTLPMSYFFVNYPCDPNRRKSLKVEELIENYSFDLYSRYQNSNETDLDGEYLLMRYDFEQLIDDINKIYISRNYLGLMSWLINRAFCISAGMKRAAGQTSSTTNNNKAILLKTLYTVNPEALLKCFSKNAENCTVENTNC